MVGKLESGDKLVDIKCLLSATTIKGFLFKKKKKERMNEAK